MQRSAVSAGHQHEVTQTPVAHDAGAGAGDDLSTLLGAGQFREAVIDHIPAVVFVKDARDFRFILLNRAGEEFLGVSRQAIIGKTDHDVFPKEEADQFVARDCEVLKSRHVQIIEEEPVHTPHNGLRFLRTRMIVICDDKQQPRISGGNLRGRDRPEAQDRAHPAHGASRRPHRPGQSRPVPPAPRCRHGGMSRIAARRGAVLHRSRRFQAAERHARPSDRRCRAATLGRALAPLRRRRAIPCAAGRR